MILAIFAAIVITHLVHLMAVGFFRFMSVAIDEYESENKTTNL